jgi:hypothetical protein
MSRLLQAFFQCIHKSSLSGRGRGGDGTIADGACRQHARSRRLAKRFIEAARAAEADETEAGAERAFKKVAGKKPAKPSKG